MNITVTLLGQMVAFVLLIWFVNKFLWGPITNMLADRQKLIEDGLAAGEKGKHELQLAEKKAKQVLKDVKVQAADIIAQAQKRAAEIVEESKDTARKEAERIITGAHAEVEREYTQAQEKLRQYVTKLALAGAEKILKEKLDSKAHDKLMDDLVVQI